MTHTPKTLRTCVLHPTKRVFNDPEPGTHQHGGAGLARPGFNIRCTGTTFKAAA